MWDTLEILQEDYIRLDLESILNYNRYFMYSLVSNSTRIEGSTLTDDETVNLLEKNITAKGKPLTDHLMVEDLFHAALFVEENAKNKQPLSIPFIQDISARVLKRTGGIVSGVAGTYDTSKGDLRKGAVRVPYKYFPDYIKIENLLTSFVQIVNKKISEVSSTAEVLKLAAEVHYNFVNIHPFGDGNGRVSRLLMNYIQTYHNKPMIKIFSEDRNDYLKALQRTEENNDITIFHDFVCQQQIKHYQIEIEKYQRRNRGFSLLF
jgi:Fic family protein